MKMNIRTAAALGALALIGTLTAAPAYAAPDRPLAPASVEFKLSPGDDSSDPEPRWKGNGEEWRDGALIKCSSITQDSLTWANCIQRRTAQDTAAKEAFNTAHAEWEARQSARSSAAQRPAYTPAPTTESAYTPPPSYTAPPTAAPKSPSSAIPWPWIGGGALLALIGWVLWRRRSMRPASVQGCGAPRPGLRDRALGLLDGLRDRVDPGPRRGHSGYDGYEPYPEAQRFDQPPAYADEQYAPASAATSPQPEPQQADIDFDTLFNRNKGDH